MKRLSALWANDKLFEQSSIIGNREQEVCDLTFNSKKCKKHHIFVAQRGLHVDGHSFIDEAIERGASVIVHSDPLKTYRKEITYIAHPHPASIASLFAHNLYGPYPETIIAVTGTDGKSTTCEFLYRILTSNGLSCGLLTTVNIDDGSKLIRSPHRQSTPEVELLYPFLHRCYLNKVDLVILETTSHALSHKTSRLAQLRFSGAIITNITSEHLDFHHTIASYIDDKLNIVRQLKKESPLVVRTSFAHKDLPPIKNLKSNQIKTYSFDEANSDCEIAGETKKVFLHERKILLSCLNEQKEFSFSFSPEVYSLNLLAALTLARSFLAVPLENLIQPQILNTPIRGRFNLLYTHFTYPIIIDFAHTEKSFEFLFSFLKKVVPTIAIVVLFGAAGERDKSKRANMGRVASNYCSKIYLTNEDPRKEDEYQIIDDIAQGIPPSKHSSLYKIVDRTEAVETAIRALRSDEILLLLGKGHETSIEYHDIIEPYDELECVMRALNHIRN